MEIPKDKNKKKRKEKLKEKNCQFPIDEHTVCGKIFFSTAKSKYCFEHRDRKYRSHIDKIRGKQNNKNDDKVSNNQIIDHKFSDPQKAEFACILEGCNEKFDIKLDPKVKVYPKYCQLHRNKYKRQRHLELLKERNGKG